ncbi:transposase [Pandoraea sputorum]|uniref:Transposase n=1 Tax=Pandoraea sputorum TaxID=93222 RepID=A0A5E5BH46_9BURK|nr:transposase [Pandoraea sputorum]
MVKCTAFGVDIAKNVFQVHYVDQETGEIVNKPIKRAKLLEFFANPAPCLIGMEACGGAHHWARQLVKMGHGVKLMAGEFVKAFNVRNKNDAADARAIWLAVQRHCKSRWRGIRTSPWPRWCTAWCKPGCKTATAAATCR